MVPLYLKGGSFCDQLEEKSVNGEVLLQGADQVLQ